MLKVRLSMSTIAPQVPRKICVFIDGTWNEASSGHPTNVHKLFDATLEGVQGGWHQMKLYIPGVGRKPKAHGSKHFDADYAVEQARLLNAEMPPATAAVARGFMGGAFGRGTAARIRSAYHFICRNFDSKRGDRVFVFGFSRGAFAAMSLAGFMGHVGLLLADEANLKHVARAYEIYEFSDDPTQTELADFLQRLTGVRLVHSDSKFYIPFHFLGLWDTVGSLGLPSRLECFSAPYTEYHLKHVPPSVMKVRHALALHELRGMFEPHLWAPNRSSDHRNVWFAGSHADVGGGYRADQTGLSDMALRWMAEEAQADDGLVLSGCVPWLDATAPATVHHEIRGKFLATWPAPRSWLRSNAREDLARHHMHKSCIDYLLNSDQMRYDFNHPFVNSALRTVNALAVPRVLLLRTFESDGDMPKAAHNGVNSGGVDWWKTVTPREIRDAEIVLASGLNTPERLEHSDWDKFSRALVLRQLLGDASALFNARKHLSNTVPDIDELRPTRQAVDAARLWLQWGEAQVTAVLRALEKLPNGAVDPACRAELEALGLLASQLKNICQTAEFHLGTRQGITLSAPVKLKPRKA